MTAPGWRLTLIWVVVAVLGLPGMVPLSAGELDDALAARWQGVWVVVGTEVYSDCLGCDAVNRLGGGTVVSEGVRRFEPGELGRVRGIEVRRARIDVWVDLVEPVLVGTPSGAFVLYEERPCSIELQVEVPREAVRERDTTRLNDQLGVVLEPFRSQEDARSSPSWNGRNCGSPPAGYEETRARFGQWRQEWARRAALAAWEVVSETLPRFGEEQYLEDFAQGVSSVDGEAWGRCDDLVRIPLPGADTVGIGAGSDGLVDGQAFSHALQLLARLRECGLEELPEVLP